MNKHLHSSQTPDTRGYCPRPRPLIPRALRTRASLAVAVAAATAVMAPSALAAGGSTICVHQPASSCPAGSIDEGSNLQSALNVAAGIPASADSPNVVDIEPGTYTGTANPGFTYQSTNPLRIVGAGSDSTTITASDSSVVTTLDLESSPTANTISVSGLTLLNSNDSGHALDLFGGTADHLVIASQQQDAVPVRLKGGTLSNSTVDAESAYQGVEGVAAAGASMELDDDTINSGTMAVESFLPTTIHRSTLVAQWGLITEDVPVSIDDSLIEAQNGIYSLAQDQSTTMKVLNDTLIGTSGANLGLLSASFNGNDSDLQIVNSIIHAFPTSFETTENDPTSHSTLEANTDNYDGMSTGTGITRTNQVGSDPGFVAPLQGNYHLGSWSDLIDASATQTLGTGSSTTDRDGNPRAVTVNNAATPVDLGAYEYQPPAPAGGGTPGSGGGTPGTGGGTPGTGGGTPGTGGGTPGTGGGTPGNGTPGSGTPAGGSHPSSPTHRALTVKLTTLGHVTVTGRRLSLRLSCTGTAACSPIKLTATAMQRHHRVTVGSLSTSLSAGHRATLSLALNRTGRALLASNGRLTVTVTVTVRNGSRTLTVQTAHVKLT